jgi:hypothetical protein
MRKSWLLCVLMGTLAWGQAQPGTTPSQAPPPQASPSPAQAPGQVPPQAAKPPAPPKEVAETAVVLTIKGVCAPKAPATASKTTTGKATAAPTKKPADCKTEITKAQFEKLAKALQQGPNPLNAQQKRQLATLLPRFMAMSDIAKTKGLDKTDAFKTKVKFLQMQILTQELQQSVNTEAEAKVTHEVVATYYKANPEAYEQFSLDRLFIPRNKTAAAEDKGDAKEPEKLTEEQQKAKDAEDKAKQEQGEQELTKLADTLRERAAKGEDFATLQKEAFEAAGTKVENPTINLPKVRRTGLPATQAGVFDLKVGEVSPIISDTGGHYIFKVVSKDVLPVDQVETEIHNKLKNEKSKEMMDAYTNSFQATPNEDYFGPAGPPGAPPPRGRGMIPQRPPQGMPPGAQQQPAPPAANPPAQAPPSNPN